MNAPIQASNARGFSIVELMVAMAVSSVLLLGLTNIFVSSNRSQTIQSTLADIHETGRFAVDQMSRHIRMTGSRTSNWVFGAVPGALTVVDGVSDTLTVQYQDTLDCNLAPAPASGFVTNTFDVLGGELRCNGVTMIDGVQELQIFLGEDTDGDAVPNRLVAPNAAGLQMNRVVSVNMNLLIASRETRAAANKPVLRRMIWNTAPDAAERRVWREYSTTVAIRNPL